MISEVMYWPGPATITVPGTPPLGGIVVIGEGVVSCPVGPVYSTSEVTYEAGTANITVPGFDAEG